MQLSLSAWPEVEDYLRRSDAIVIPIGSTEQHGPSGLIGTDALCPEGIARAAEARRPDGVLVGPTFSVGSAQHHLGFPGSITLRPSTMIAALHDWITSLRQHGFRRFYFLNGHGGNIAPVKTAFGEWFSQFSLSGGDARTVLVLRNWWELGEVEKVCKELYGAAHGSHATPSEVAVTYALYPTAEARLRPKGKLSPAIAPKGSFGDARDYRRRFPDGRIGSDPTLATAADGRRLIDMAAAALLEELDALALAPLDDPRTV
ncbi:MAG: creatininase family protein [Myxococcota bacterium]